MTEPIIETQKNVAPGVDQLGTFAPIPNLGYIAINAFLLRSREPVLVDAGIIGMKGLMLPAIESLIDPASLRYIYLTHADGDHVGCLDELLVRAPKARIVTTFLGMAKLGFARQVPPERFLLLNPGQTLDVGDRKLLVARPPCFDAPETTMVWDASTRTLFSSDYFGGLVPSPTESANDIPSSSLREGMMRWLALDSPWIHSVRQDALEQATRSVAELAPQTILSAHLPPARALVEALTENVNRAPGGTPFQGPDQSAFEDLIKQAS